MHRIKKLLLSGGAAALALAATTLASTPAAVAASPVPEDCTFCSSYLQHCGVWNVYRICYTKLNGPGTCPPCTGCMKFNIDE